MSVRASRAPAARAVDLAAIAVFSAVTIALGAVFLPLPFSPVPVTGQTLGVVLAANVLGPKRAVASVSLVLLIAAAGMPVLAGGRGGMGVLFGSSGGYFLGWIAVALVLGYATSRLGPGRSALIVRILLNCTLGVFLVYLFGVPWLAIVSERPLWEMAVAGMLPYLPGDLFKAVLAAMAAQAVLVSYRRPWVTQGR
ncbi:MAG: biotin transporter BioY [Dehalococcoidia bacterium]